MTGLTLTVFFLCLSSATALLLRPNPPVATSDGRPINESCLALADQGSCGFYTCFENRLPCGRYWYMLKTGQYYCNKILRGRSNFSQEGQQFLNDAQVCLTRSLKNLYQRDSVGCHVLELHAISAITPCFTENGFCDVFRTDSRHFYNIYETRDLFTRRAGKVWRQIFSLANRCGEQALREFSTNARETVANALKNFFDTLSDRFGM